MQVNGKSSERPDVELIPRIAETPSRLQCRFGWNEATTREFLGHHFEKMVLLGDRCQDFRLPSLGEKALGLKLLSLKSLGHVEGLEQFANLEDIDIIHLTKNGIDLSRFGHLQRLFVEKHKSIEKQIPKLRCLKELDIVGYSGQDCTAFAYIPHLVSLGLTQGKPASLQGLESCSELENLSLAYLRNLSEISALKSMRGLRSLSLTNLPKMTETIHIAAYSGLQSLYVVDCKGSVDLSGLRGLQSLKKLWLNVHCENINWEDILLLPDIALVGLMTGPSTPSDNELQRLAETLGKQLYKIERAGAGRKKRLHLYLQ